MIELSLQETKIVEEIVLRALMEHGTHKAALKRIDRLLGNPRIGQEAQVVGAALLRRWGQGRQPLVIAVDWSEVAPDGVFVELRAALTRPGMGRGLTIYQQVYPESKLGNGRAERALLNRLHAWIPAGVPVVIVTDAGFRRPWFTQVERLGWSWIGRIRAGVCVSRERTHWEQASAWFAKATRKACRWWNDVFSRNSTVSPETWCCAGSVRWGRKYGAPVTARRRERVRAQASARERGCSRIKQIRSFRADEIVAVLVAHEIEGNSATASRYRGYGLEVVNRARAALACGC